MTMIVRNTGTGKIQQMNEVHYERVKEYFELLDRDGALPKEKQKEEKTVKELREELMDLGYTSKAFLRKDVMKLKILELREKKEGNK